VRDEPANATCVRCGAALSATITAAPAPTTAKPTGKLFRDPKRLTQWVQWLLVAVALIHIIFGVCAVLQALMLNAMVNGLPSTLELTIATRAKELRAGATGTLMSIVYFAAVLAFAIWTYRMNANIHALGGNNLRFTPGWAVGWYFVPVANLWKPYQMMRELWLASNNPADWRVDRTSKLLTWWWASWLATVLFPFVSLIYMVRLSVRADVFGQLEVMEVLGVVSATLGLMAAILAYFVVAKIGAFQAQAADRSLSAVFA
jgi:hypothetical protein